MTMTCYVEWQRVGAVLNRHSAELKVLAERFEASGDQLGAVVLRDTITRIGWVADHAGFVAEQFGKAYTARKAAAAEFSAEATSTMDGTIVVTVRQSPEPAARPAAERPRRRA